MSALKCFQYGGDRVIAKSDKDARRALRKETGEQRIAGLTRAVPPFMLVVQDGKPFEVSEAEYCRLVETYGDGIVKRF